MEKFLCALAFALPAFSACADVQLPKIFGDNMVLQRDREITFWGWADPKEKITVNLNKQTKSVVAGKDGKWKLQLAPEGAGGPFQVIVKGKKDTRTFSNVLIGDVWICSGQSNMEWTVKNSNNAMAEISAGNSPMIRHIKIPNTVAMTPKEDVKNGDWRICTPETVGDFTAVGYFFAQELTRELNVPVGLINASWSGTHVETWTSREAFENSDEFKEMIAAIPTLNLDSLSKQKKELAIRNIEKSQGPLNNDPAVIQSWKDLSTDDWQWKKMELPGNWEGKALPDFNGVVWFRKSIEVKVADAGKEAYLELARVDDADDTYVNGVLVGQTKQYNVHRQYKIPAGTLKEGKNVIAVRVEDTGGNGGMVGDEPLRITVENKIYPLSGEWRYRVESIKLSGIEPNTYPTLLFNAMVNPLIPYGIKGALWYQGEANAGRAYQYRKAFPLMISDWRTRWNQGNFPFYFVQLASFNADYGTSKTGSTWAELREAQTATLSVPNTGMAVTTDIGTADDIHPRNKQDVGKRLAALALNRTYDKRRVDSGPTFKSMEIKGDRIVLTFQNIGGGLVAKDKYGYLKGFEIAGSDGQFHYARADVEGNTVVVYQEGITTPVAVRFGWADEASDNNLYNAEGFPALPFRTDTWKGVTENVKFH